MVNMGNNENREDAAMSAIEDGLGMEDAEMIIDKYPGKPGLDDSGGKYKVLGAVTLQQVFRRKKAGTNIAPAVGYRILEIETGREMMVEKKQGVQICAQYGMQNAYIIYRTKEKKGADGEVLKTTPSVYLQPYPSRQEAFSQDDRLVTVFKMNAEGSLIRPLELMVEEEECTQELWRIIMKEYDRGNKKAKRNRRGSEDEHRKMMEKLKSALKRQDHVKNPFDM